jgi:hypothetical protein
MKESSESANPLSREKLKENFRGTGAEQVWLDWNEEKQEIFANMSLTSDEDWVIEHFREDANEINKIGEELAHQHGVKFNPLNVEEEIQRTISSIEAGRKHLEQDTSEWVGKLKEAGVDLSQFEPITSVSIHTKKADEFSGEVSKYHKLIQGNVLVDGFRSDIFDIGGGHITVESWKE